MKLKEKSLELKQKSLVEQKNVHEPPGSFLKIFDSTKLLLSKKIKEHIQYTARYVEFPEKPSGIVRFAGHLAGVAEEPTIFIEKGLRVENEIIERVKRGVNFTIQRLEDMNFYLGGKGSHRMHVFILSEKTFAPFKSSPREGGFYAILPAYTFFIGFEINAINQNPFIAYYLITHETIHYECKRWSRSKASLPEWLEEGMVNVFTLRILKPLRILEPAIRILKPLGLTIRFRVPEDTAAALWIKEQMSEIDFKCALVLDDLKFIEEAVRKKFGKRAVKLFPSKPESRSTTENALIFLRNASKIDPNFNKFYRRMVREGFLKEGELENA